LEIRENIITDSIPHRDPFLFVDKVLEINEKSIKTSKLMDAKMDFFKGHYPHKPLVPGVILCEAVFQSGAILIANIEKFSQNAVPVLAKIGEVKFRKMILPGDEIEITAEIVEKVSNVYFMKGTVSCGGKNSVRVEFAVSMVNEQ